MGLRSLLHDRSGVPPVRTEWAEGAGVTGWTPNKVSVGGPVGGLLPRVRVGVRLGQTEVVAEVGTATRLSRPGPTPVEERRRW